MLIRFEPSGPIWILLLLLPLRSTPPFYELRCSGDHTGLGAGCPDSCWVNVRSNRGLWEPVASMYDGNFFITSIKQSLIVCRCLSSKRFIIIYIYLYDDIADFCETTEEFNWTYLHIPPRLLSNIQRSVAVLTSCWCSSIKCSGDETVFFLIWGLVDAVNEFQASMLFFLRQINSKRQTTNWNVWLRLFTGTPSTTAADVWVAVLDQF